MGAFIGFPSELDAIKKGVDLLSDSNEDYDTVRADDLGEDFDIESYRQRDDVEVVEQGSRNGEDFYRLVPRSDDARSVLEPQDTSEPVQNPNQPNGGDIMTDDYEFELNGTETRHAGSLVDNQSDEYDADGDEIEALGTASYIEEIVTDQRDDIDLDDVAEYIADQDEFNFGAMIEYKADMGDKDYEQFVDAVDDVVGRATDLTDEVEAKGAIFEGLYGETKTERDNAQEAISGIMDSVSDLQTSSDWLDQAADLAGAQQDERAANARFNDLKQQAQNL